MTADNPFMPDVIRDAIVPGAAQAFLEDDDVADGVLVTRDNYDLGINAEDTTRETLRGVLARERHRQRSPELRSFVRLRRDEEPDRRATTTGSRTAGWRRSMSVEDPTTGSRCAVLARSGRGSERSPAACRTTSSATACAIQARGRFRQHGQRQSHTKVDAAACVSGSFSGDFGSFMELPGGAIGFAVGAEYRQARPATPMPALEIQDGSTWNGPIAPSEGSFDVKEVFAEINVPVLKDARFADKLSFGAAFRASDYSTVGKTSSWKVDARVGAGRVR